MMSRIFRQLTYADEKRRTKISTFGIEMRGNRRVPESTGVIVT